MIVLVRIDDRLLHGQIALSWKSELDYDAIVIADDAAAKDELRKNALKLGVPDGVRLAIRDMEEAVKVLHHEKLQNMRVLVVVSSTQNAKRLYELLSDTPHLNIGGIQAKEGTKMFSKAVYFDKADIETLDAIEAMGVEINVQEVPSTTKYKYRDLREKFLSNQS